MLNLIKSDSYKLRKSPSVWLILSLSCIGSFIMILSSHLVSTGDMSRQVASSLPAFFVDSQMITLLGCVITSFSLSTDFENKVISSAISTGFSRSTIVISKILVLLILIILILLPYLVPVIILSFTNLSFISFIETPLLKILASGPSQTSTDFYAITKVVSSLILVYFSQLSICIPIMFLFKRPVTTLAISYVSILILGPITSFNKTISNIMNYTPFGMKPISSLGFSMSTLDFVHLTLICVSCVFICGLVSHLIFRRSEIS